MATKENTQNKKTNFKTIMLVVLALIVLLLVTTGVAYFVAKTIAGGNISSNPMENHKIYKTYSAGEYLTNLSDRGYIKLSVVYLIKDKETEKELEIKDSEIRDKVFTILRAKKYDAVRDSKGMEVLRDEIKSSINESLFKGHIEDVFFTSIIVN